MSSAAKGAATRRIRRRAAKWRELRLAAVHDVAHYEKQFQQLAEGSEFMPELMPAHSPVMLGEVFQRTLEDRRKAVRYCLRSRLREPRMAPYYREQAIKGLAALRQVPTAKIALDRVLSRLEGGAKK